MTTWSLETQAVTPSGRFLRSRRTDRAMPLPSMEEFMTTPARIDICIISLIVSATAFAQNNRSAVSVNGSDLNLCTTVSPCRSFGVALAHTSAGGEVIAFDSGGYGPFTINQSVSVIGAPGVHAALTASSSHGIDVAAGASDSVKIRGLNVTVNDIAAIGINAPDGRRALPDGAIIRRAAQPGHCVQHAGCSL